MQNFGTYVNDLQWYDFNKSISNYLITVKNVTYSTIPKPIENKKPHQKVSEMFVLPLSDRDKPCKFCDLINIPPYFHGPPYLETVEHILVACPLYHNLRMRLSDKLKSIIVRADYKNTLNSSTDPGLSSEFEKFIKSCVKLRKGNL